MKIKISSLCISIMGLSQAGYAQTSIPPGPISSPDGSLVGAWTQFIPGTGQSKLEPATVELRFVVQATSTTSPPKLDQAYCGDFVIAYTKSDGTQGLDTKLTARTHPLEKGKRDSKNFPIAVCTKTLPQDWADLKIIKSTGSISDPAEYIWYEDGATSTQAELPGPYKVGRRHKDGTTAVIRSVTLGDTGCRGARDGQNCQSQNDWPQATIVQSAANQNPDLILHVGDYRYFYEGKTPDTWSYWLKDFVEPARPLLVKAPWALSRGNHEQCSPSWYGKGYSFLFGPTDTPCNFLLDPTWHFDVAPGGFDISGNSSHAQRYIMIDTSNEYGGGLDIRFEDALKQSNQESTWWISHIPPVNMLYYGGAVHPGTRGVYDAMHDAIDNTGIALCDTGRTGQPKCRPNTVLLGHNHMFQTVQFFDKNNHFTWPQMYIVGHGGVDLRGASVPDSCTYTFDLPDKTSKAANIQSRRSFGFVTWERSSATAAKPSGWTAIPRDKNGNPWHHTSPSTQDCVKKDKTVAEDVNVDKKPWWKFWDD